MTDELEPQRVEAWRAFLRAHAVVVERVSDDFDGAGVIPLAWYDVLVALAQAPQRRLRMAALADAMLINRANATRLVDRLEAAGLLRREKDAIDGRGAWAVLTREGFSAFRRAMPVYMRSIDQHFARHLSDSEVEVLTTVMERLQTASEASPNGARPRTGRSPADRRRRVPSPG